MIFHRSIYNKHVLKILFYRYVSESANAVGAGATVPAAESGRTPIAEVFKQVISTFRVNDWNLFGASTL